MYIYNTFYRECCRGYSFLIYSFLINYTNDRMARLFIFIRFSFKKIFIISTAQGYSIAIGKRQYE